MMKHDKFAVFIMTHGRPNKVITYKTLLKHGYTGDIYIVIDNEDDCADEYYKLYGDKVIQFDKLEVSKTFDTMDNFNNRKTVVYARNVCFELAKKLDLDYFLECDDNYDNFSYRIERDGQLIQKQCFNLDIIFDIMIDFLDATKAKTVAFSQAGDFVGGLGSNLWKHKILRKSMNSFFCKTDNKIDFIGRINEDVNTYTRYGSIGELYFTIAHLMLNQLMTQSNAGGMTDVYLESGTYVKSFYSIICSPSCVKISTLGGGGNGNQHRRIHHKIKWNNCTPKIINERYKKC